jgi:hypothetical protein
MLAKGILKFWDEKEIEKHVSRAKARRTPRFAKISKDLSLRSWLSQRLIRLSPRLIRPLADSGGLWWSLWREKLSWNRFV